MEAGCLKKKGGRRRGPKTRDHEEGRNKGRTQNTPWEMKKHSSTQLPRGGGGPTIQEKEERTGILRKGRKENKGRRDFGGGAMGGRVRKKVERAIRKRRSA